MKEEDELALTKNMYTTAVLIIIMYIYNVPNDALSAYRMHNNLKTMLSKYIHI